MHRNASFYAQALKFRASPSAPAPTPYDADLCVTCAENARETILAPCHHRGLCEPCTKRVLEKADPECPFCRQAISTYVNPCKAFDP